MSLAKCRLQNKYSSALSLLSFSPGWTNITELWNISSAIYLYSAPVRAEITRNIGTSPSSDVACNRNQDPAMKRDKGKKLLDFAPLIILTIQAIILVWTVTTTDIAFLWKHIVGLLILPVNFWVFRWQHKFGVLFLGLTLIIGLLGFLSYSPEVETTTITLGRNKAIPVFYGQPIFLLWLLIHFIVSGRHYVGIVTKEYWAELLNKSQVERQN